MKTLNSKLEKDIFQRICTFNWWNDLRQGWWTLSGNKNNVTSDNDLTIKIYSVLAKTENINFSILGDLF